MPKAYLKYFSVIYVSLKNTKNFSLHPLLFAMSNTIWKWRLQISQTHVNNTMYHIRNTISTIAFFIRQAEADTDSSAFARKPLLHSAISSISSSLMLTKKTAFFPAPKFIFLLSFPFQILTIA